MICGQCDPGGKNIAISFVLELQSNNTVRGRVFSGSASIYPVVSSGTITDTNTWHHLAFVRDGNTLRLFIDGTADGTADVTDVTINDSANKLAVGRSGEYDDLYWNGWIDEFRISKGIARSTADFTPPSAQYYYEPHALII